MTATEKLDAVKAILDITDNSEDGKIELYLNLARREIIAWLNSDYPVVDVPNKYETVQIMSVVTGYNLSGAEGETSHNENGISRTFKYADMVQYIRANVIPYAKVFIDEMSE